jgi:glycosyltransferase involved in cell wall biosynthesis
MNTLWTIGILHLSNKPNRIASYNLLVNELQKQIQNCNASDIVEIVTETDNGENSVGKKRNNLLSKAKGEYVCFIDDDDMVTDIYVSHIVKALQNKPDVVELVGFLPHHNLPFIHNLVCGGHFRKDGIQYRTPNHLNTIKTEIARKIGYKEISHGEDQEYSHRLWDSGLMKTEELIGKRMYIYQFNPKTSETTKFAGKR